MAFVDSIDVPYSLTHDMERVLKKHTLLSAAPDNQFLFKIPTKPACSTETIIKIDLQTVKDA